MLVAVAALGRERRGCAYTVRAPLSVCVRVPPAPAAWTPTTYVYVCPSPHSLSGNNLGEEGGKAIGASLQHTPNLQTLA